MKLADLLKDVNMLEAHGSLQRTIGGLRYDSRQVAPGDLFFAWRGEKSDGHEFIPQVCARGAAAVVLAQDPPVRKHGSTFIRVTDPRRVLATVSAEFFSHPDRVLPLLGVTGTNGKTTTTFILKHLLQDEDKPVGLIGTVRYEIGPRLLPAERTTPESLDLNGLLAQMRDAGCSAVAMEVSSHALAQGRVAPLQFAAGIFTNLTRDHLDYHPTMEAYFEAKAQLFNQLRPTAGRFGNAIINLDDAYGSRLVERLGAGDRVLTYSAQNRPEARLGVEALEMTAAGTRGRIRLDAALHPFSLPLLGAFNVANMLAAIGGALAMGRPLASILERLRTIPQVPGRLETFCSPDGVTAVVDYAHTDDAVRQALTALRGIVRKRLLVVLGCGGNRDKPKRPRMAQAALALADYAIFTSDNPRYEKAESILEEMTAGLSADPGRFEQIVDRRQAIAHALALARPGDIVCVAGKGHETSQEIEGQFHPFDDRLVVQEFLNRRILS